MNKIIALYQYKYDPTDYSELRNGAIVHNTDNDLYSIWVRFDRQTGKAAGSIDGFKTLDDAKTKLLVLFPNIQLVFERDVAEESNLLSSPCSTITEEEFKRIVEEHRMCLSYNDNCKVADLSSRCMTDWQIRDIDLSYAGMSFALMNGSSIINCKFEGTNFKYSWLKGSTFANVQMHRTRLAHTDLRGIYCRDVDFKDANMEYCDLQNADLRGANLNGTNLCGADLRGADLTGANLNGANLSGAYMSEAILNDVDLSNSNLYETSLLCASMKHTKLCNARLDRAKLKAAEMFETDLTGACGKDINFQKAYMCGVNLTNAQFTRPDFRESNLIAAIMKKATVANGNFQNSDLSHADLSFSDFSHTYLQGAKLYGANIEYTNFYHADLSGADVDNAMFYKCNMEGAITRGTYLFPKAIANYIMNEGTSETTTGNWCISFEEINRQFDVNLPTDETLLAEILKYFDDNIVSDVEITDSEFDMTFYTDYCPNVEEETEMEV